MPIKTPKLILLDFDGTLADTFKEMVDMITATRAYEANATVVTNAKSMATSALSIGR